MVVCLLARTTSWACPRRRSSTSPSAPHASDIQNSRVETKRARARRRAGAHKRRPRLSAPSFPAPRRLQYQLLFLAAVHGACSKLFSTYATGAFQAKSAVMAHYVPFLICFVGMAAYGDYLWLADEGLNEGFDKTWGFHAGAEAIVVSMLAVQLYDIPVSLSVDDLRVPTFIAHHFAVLYLAVVVLKYRCFYYYAVYFLGVVDRVDIKSSMCAHATVSTRGFLPCFENSMRAIDSSKHQPNRRRCDRDGEF